MGFFDKPIAGLKPADSVVIALAVAVGVVTIYSAKVGPVADVHMTNPGDGPVNASIKKAGWQSWVLVAGVTLMARDLNVAILGGSAIIMEHAMYLHADMCNPADGQIVPKPGAYSPAPLSAVASGH
jgi:hypothetical protein